MARMLRWLPLQAPNQCRTIQSKASFVSHLEVERKFSSTATLKENLDRLGECTIRPDPRSKNKCYSKPLPKLKAVRQPTKKIRDIYYDKDDLLSQAGVWIRCRDSCTVDGTGSSCVLGNSASRVWQAEVRIAGDYIESQVTEVEGLASIEDVLERQLPGTRLSELLVLADLQTLRHSWTVYGAIESHHVSKSFFKDGDPQLRIDIDSVTAPHYALLNGQTFRHEVGEVELVGEIRRGVSEE